MREIQCAATLDAATSGNKTPPGPFIIRFNSPTHSTLVLCAYKCINIYLQEGGKLAGEYDVGVSLNASPCRYRITQPKHSPYLFTLNVNTLHQWIVILFFIWAPLWAHHLLTPYGMSDGGRRLVRRLNKNLFRISRAHWINELDGLTVGSSWERENDWK